MKFSMKDFFNKCDHIWSRLLKKSFMENFFFCTIWALELKGSFARSANAMQSKLNIARRLYDI